MRVLFETGQRQLSYGQRGALARQLSLESPADCEQIRLFASRHFLSLRRNIPAICRLVANDSPQSRQDRCP